MDFYQLVDLCITNNASDLHLSSGHKPLLRIDGQLTPCTDRKLDSTWFDKNLAVMLNHSQQQQLSTQRELDYSISIKNNARLRGNIFIQHHGISAAYRRISVNIPSLDEIQAPAILKKLAQQQSGLILITGATGSGKSTTLASLVNYINQHVARHIITMEDPIEFIHTSNNSLIQQREIGLHTISFNHGLRAALRQDPDIILLGELRDQETIRLALTAAETGHLVLASIHTRNASQSIRRIIDVFPAEEKAYIRNQLSESLQAIIAQCLLPKKTTGRLAAFEVLINTAAVANLIRENKTHQLSSLLQTGSAHGMQTMQQSIQQYITQGMLDSSLLATESSVSD